MGKRKFYEAVVKSVPPMPFSPRTFTGIIAAANKKEAARYAQEKMVLKMEHSTTGEPLEVEHVLVSLKLTTYAFVSDIEMVKSMITQAIKTR